MKYLFLLHFIFLSGSIHAEHASNITETSKGPQVFSFANYDVELVRDLSYGKALSHTSWNSDETSEMDLLLDLYKPVGVSGKRPVIFIFHGGGFEKGSKEREEIVSAGNFFAARGFIAIAVTYRVVSHYGTLPDNLYEALQDWPEFLKKDRDAFFAMYPACRDAKAAVRWLYANAEQLNADTNYITAYGNSAGALISVVLGTSDARQFTHEIALERDPTLSSTHLEYPAQIHTIINHWGGPLAIDMQRYFFDNNPYDHYDAPMQIVHGTLDTRVPFIEAMRLAFNFAVNDIHFELHPLHWVGHDAVGKKVKGLTQDELALDFIVRMQNIKLTRRLDN